MTYADEWEKIGLLEDFEDHANGNPTVDVVKKRPFVLSCEL